MNKRFKLSIVIPTYNEEADIGNCINSLLNQSYNHFELIIVDDGSTDKTREIVKRFKSIKLIEGEHKGPGFSRNLGAKKAKGEILIFVDADMTFEKDYLKALIKPIIDRKTRGTEDGKQISSNPKNIWSRCWGLYFKQYPHVSEGKIFRAILKKEFDRMGGFDPKYGYADDLTFYYKYGVNSLRVPNAICYHKNPSTLKEVYKQSKWIGSSIQNKILSAPLIKYFIPLFMVLASPLVIPLLSIRKSHKNKDFKIFFPWMLIFISVRYFGTIDGIFRKIFFNKNIR